MTRLQIPALSRALVQVAMYTLSVAARTAPDLDAKAIRAHLPLLGYLAMPAGPERVRRMTDKVTA